MNATTHDAATNETKEANVAQEVSLGRIYVLRAAYLLLVIGLGGMIVPDVVSHPVISRGVIPSLLGAVWVLAFVGLKYPLEMLPLLMFEFAWKAIWLFDYGLSQWLTACRNGPPANCHRPSPRIPSTSALASSLCRS